jgi:hypothetical protein
MNYFVHKDGNWIGPFSVEQIKTMIGNSSATTEDYVCREGTQDTVPIKQVPDFFTGTNRPLPPPPFIPSVPNRESEYRFYTAFGLCFMFGIFGVHRFYLKREKAVLQLCTLGGLGIWSLIDLVTLLLGKFEDGQGIVLSNPKPKLTWTITILFFLFCLGSQGKTSNHSSNFGDGSSKTGTKSGIDMVPKGEKYFYQSKAELYIWVVTLTSRNTGGKIYFERCDDQKYECFTSDILQSNESDDKIEFQLTKPNGIGEWDGYEKGSPYLVTLNKGTDDLKLGGATWDVTLTKNPIPDYQKIFRDMSKKTLAQIEEKKKRPKPTVYTLAGFYSGPGLYGQGATMELFSHGKFIYKDVGLPQGDTAYGDWTLSGETINFYMDGQRSFSAQVGDTGIIIRGQDWKKVR